MAGPMAAHSPAGSAPSPAMASTAAVTTPSSMPRRPAWTAATMVPSSAARSRGTQSATMTAAPAGRRAAGEAREESTSASAAGASSGRVWRRARATTAEWIWFIQARPGGRGPAPARRPGPRPRASSSRRRARPTRAASSPTCRARLSPA